MRRSADDKNKTAHHSEKKFPGAGRAALAILLQPRLVPRALRCVAIIWRKFFFFQYRSALFPGIPVSRAEHELDSSIPFNPHFIKIYLDFTQFWIRITGFFILTFGKKGTGLAAEFLGSITGLYTFAFEIYKKNLSTTARPNYKKGFHFRLIHLVDPHLMCIPSLHVMLMIHSYTVFRRALRVLDRQEEFRKLAEKVFYGALAITEAVLYVKQHSINCVSAAMYAMTRYDPLLFDVKAAEELVYSLFDSKNPGVIPQAYTPFYKGALVNPKDAAWIREHIIGLYRVFLEANSSDWTIPLLEFLKSLPGDSELFDKVHGTGSIP